MIDPRVPAIFEAAFEYENIRIRVDVLERLAHGTWGLREVKSSSGLKDHYLDDIALQTYVLRGAGVAVSSIELLHVNTKYARGPSGICWTDFFVRLDVGDAVAVRLIDLPARVPAMRDCLGMIELPDAEPGSQCGTPYSCEFWDRCTVNKPADWIGYFPRLSQARASELKAQGIESISSIPSDFPLTSKQVIIRDATASGKPYILTDLGRLLHTFGPPACYLDFEAMMPPIPLYEGTRPYQTIPFQWSLHKIDSDDVLNHKEFLADGVNDPRRQFAETLIEALACSDYPIIVYSAYEQTRLKELAADFPDLSTALNALIARLADLLPETLGRKQDGQRINALSHLLMRDDDFDHAVLGELEPRAGIRKRLFQFNEVQNDQRELIFGQRIELMKDENVGEMVADMRRAFVEDVVTKHVPEHARAEQWDLAGLKEELKRVLEIDLPVDQWTGIAKRELLSRIERRADEKMLAKVTQWGADVMRYVEKTILLQTIDHLWCKHLEMLDRLPRESAVQSGGRHDELQEYKSKALNLFEGMAVRLREAVTAQLMRVEIVPPEDKISRPIPSEIERTEPRQVDRDSNNPATWGRVGRNEDCPCGSGKKYKHGPIDPSPTIDQAINGG